MLAIAVEAGATVAAITRLASIATSTAIQDGVKTVLTAIQKTAQRNHRYNRRTGRLDRAIKVSVTKDGGSVYIDEGAAPYGKYVHNGTRKWDPDPFLSDAYEVTERSADAVIDRAVDRAIQQAGFR